MNKPQYADQRPTAIPGGEVIKILHKGTWFDYRTIADELRTVSLKNMILQLI